MQYDHWTRSLFTREAEKQRHEILANLLNARICFSNLFDEDVTRFLLRRQKYRLWSLCNSDFPAFAFCLRNFYEFDELKAFSFPFFFSSFSTFHGGVTEKFTVNRTNIFYLKVNSSTPCLQL